MDRSQAISSLPAEIASHHADLYLFQSPEQKEKFFIGEAVIAAAATVLLTAFLDGLQSSLKDKAKNLGETLGSWIGDKLRPFFHERSTHS